VYDRYTHIYILTLLNIYLDLHIENKKIKIIFITLLMIIVIFVHNNYIYIVSKYKNINHINFNQYYLFRDHNFLRLLLPL